MQIISSKTEVSGSIFPADAWVHKCYLPSFFAGTFGDGVRSRFPGGGPVAPRGGVRCRAAPSGQRDGGIAATSRRSRPPPLVLSCLRSDLRSASKIYFSSSKLSAHPCPPASLTDADLSADLSMCLSLLLPAHSFTSLFLLFLLILSSPFISGSAPCS